MKFKGEIDAEAEFEGTPQEIRQMAEFLKSRRKNKLAWRIKDIDVPMGWKR
jgi:hypothetical protein